VHPKRKPKPKPQIFEKVHTVKSSSIKGAISTLGSRGVQSLKILTPTPLLLRLNILRLRSDTETFQSFGLRLLLKLQSELSKLLAVSKP